MIVMLHGAVNLQNFGDYIFAELFYSRLKENGIEPVFYNHKRYGISDFFKKYLGYESPNISPSKLLNSCDALIYFSGGYFREPQNRSIIKQIRHIKRYLLLAIPFLRCNKPIYILGVGAGPFSKGVFSCFAKLIMNKSKIITVRNKESFEYCKDLCLKREVTVTSDTALVVKDYFMAQKNKLYQIESLGKKSLAIHLVPGNDVIEFSIKSLKPAIIRFLNNYPEYRLFIIQDALYSKEKCDEFLEVFEDLNPKYIPYSDPWEVCAYLNHIDMIITFKLHVGIVGATFGKSVLSFPVDFQKTKRFYDQIGEPDRCVSMESNGEETVYQMLDRFKDKMITIPKELKEAAESNLKYLDYLC